MCAVVNGWGDTVATGSGDGAPMCAASLFAGRTRKNKIGHRSLSVNAGRFHAWILESFVALR
jgi:hypothetical protein